MSSKLAFRTEASSKTRVKSAERAFRTRLPPKFTRQPSRTSVSHETSSKTHHTSSLQNAPRVKSPKRASRTRLPPKVILAKSETLSKNQAASLIGAHTSSSPAKQFCDCTPSKQHPLTRRPQCHGDIHLHHQLATSWFPAPATKIDVSTRLTCAKYCACHEM